MTSPGGKDPRASRVSPRVFNRLPTVRPADEIVDSAFRRASRITISHSDAFQRLRTTEIARVRSAQNTVSAALQGYVKRFPSFDGLPQFYQELVDLLVDLDRTRKALGALDWARKRVDEIGDESVRLMKRGRFAEEILAPKSKAYGRIASILQQVNKDLLHLDGVRRELRRLPVIEPEHPTIVVAGYPNVGKSSLVRKVSSGKPEVASYPFTTKGVVVGHFERNFVKHQIVDTPGLLDRDLEARNAVELQAIYALRHLGDVIVFIIDPTEHCGYSLESQRKLLEDTKAAFPHTPFLVVASKKDIPEAKPVPEAEVFFSAETGEGVEALMDAAHARIAAAKAANAANAA